MRILNTYKVNIEEIVNPRALVSAAPLIVYFDFELLPWSIVLVLPGVGYRLGGALRAYPNFDRGYRDWLAAMWEPEEYSLSLQLIQELQSKKITLKSMPNYFIREFTEHSCLHGLGSKASRQSEYELWSLVIPTQRRDAVISHLNDQYVAFGDMSFYDEEIILNFEPLIYKYFSLNKVELTNDDLTKAALAFGLPPRITTNKSIQAAIEVLREYDAMSENSLRDYLRRIFMPTVGFSKHNSFQRSKANLDPVDPVLEEGCNALRAKVFGKTKSPFFYPTITLRLLERTRWLAESKSPKDTELMFEELERYVTAIEEMYPEVLVNPFQ